MQNKSNGFICSISYKRVACAHTDTVVICTALLQRTGIKCTEAICNELLQIEQTISLIISIFTYAIAVLNLFSKIS